VLAAGRESCIQSTGLGGLFPSTPRRCLSACNTSKIGPSPCDQSYLLAADRQPRSLWKSTIPVLSLFHPCSIPALARPSQTGSWVVHPVALRISFPPQVSPFSLPLPSHKAILPSISGRGRLKPRHHGTAPVRAVVGRSGRHKNARDEPQEDKSPRRSIIIGHCRRFPSTNPGFSVPRRPFPLLLAMSPRRRSDLGHSPPASLRKLDRSTPGPNHHWTLTTNRHSRNHPLPPFRWASQDISVDGVLAGDCLTNAC
jgi:hypothetical protein